MRDLFHIVVPFKPIVSDLFLKQVRKIIYEHFGVPSKIWIQHKSDWLHEEYKWKRINDIKCFKITGIFMTEENGMAAINSIDQMRMI